MDPGNKKQSAFLTSLNFLGPTPSFAGRFRNLKPVKEERGLVRKNSLERMDQRHLQHQQFLRSVVHAVVSQRSARYRKTDLGENSRLGGILPPLAAARAMRGVSRQSPRTTKGGKKGKKKKAGRHIE